MLRYEPITGTLSSLIWLIPKWNIEVTCNTLGSFPYEEDIKRPRTEKVKI